MVLVLPVTLRFQNIALIQLHSPEGTTIHVIAYSFNTSDVNKTSNIKTKTTRPRPKHSLSSTRITQKKNNSSSKMNNFSENVILYQWRLETSVDTVK